MGDWTVLEFFIRGIKCLKCVIRHAMRHEYRVITILFHDFILVIG